jgi:geranylgeranyl diphosphate synthase type II
MSSSTISHRELIETALEEFAPSGHLLGAMRLNEAIRFALFPGGKRLRPMLALMGAEVAGCSTASALPAACATEFLHASSLIFDDMPAMDDADVRRGRPALHLSFGEDTALLTALALLNQAYLLFGSTPALLCEAVECIGVNGMIGGQAADLAIRAAGGASHRGRVSRNRKTTGLMRLTMTAGAMAGGASANDVRVLAHCGECLGEAYQTYDDLLDEFGGCEQTGKTARQDSRHHRASHVAEFGIDASREHVYALTEEAKACLRAHFGATNAVLAMLCAIDRVMSHSAAAAGLVSA